MNDHDRPSNMPAILVVILALLGFSVLPTGQGGRGGPANQATGTAAPSQKGEGHNSSSEDEGHGKDLGPVRLLKDHWGGTDLAGKGETELLEHAKGLRFLIVTVPDPDDTSVSHDFDSILAAVLRAAESEGYVAERYLLPWDPESTGKPSVSEPEPLLRPVPRPDARPPTGHGGREGTILAGAILCRHVNVAENQDGRGTAEGKNQKGEADAEAQADKANASEQDENLLMLLLVPETPAWGIDKKRLRAAIDLAIKHEHIIHKTNQRENDQNVDDRIRIVGPTFSGSFESLAEAIKGCLRKEEQTTSCPHGLTISRGDNPVVWARAG